LEVLPRREFEKFIFDSALDKGASEEEAAMQAVTCGGTLTRLGRLLVPEGTKTNVKLHELGHKKYGRSKGLITAGVRTVDDVAYEELMAEKFSWEARDKPITCRVAYPAVLTLMYDQQLRSREAVSIVVQVLEKYMGIPVSREDKKEMYYWAKIYRRYNKE